MAETNKVVPMKPRAAVKKTVKKAAPKKTAAKKKAASKKVVVKKPILKKTVAKKPATKKATAQKAAIKKQAPKAVKKPSIAQKAKPQTQFKKTNPKPTQSFTTKPLEAIMTQPNFEKAQAQFDQITKEAANLNREGVDAFVKSGTIFAKGFELLMKETMSFAQNTAEKQMQLAKDAMTCKTINEFSDAQNKLAQTGFDDLMSGTTKITEMGVKLLTEAIEPINEQMTKTVQKATDAVAAE